MTDYNRITVVGRLTKDPITEHFQGDKKKCSFSVANNQYNKKDKDAPNYYNCAVWGQKADFVQNNFTKGKAILVSGRHDSRIYNDKVYWDVNADEVHFVGSKNQNTVNNDSDDNISEDDIPF